MTEQRPRQAQGPTPSRFVTVLAWICAVTAVVGLVASLGQALHLYDLGLASAIASGEHEPGDIDPEGESEIPEEPAQADDGNAALQWSGRLARSLTGDLMLRARGLISRFPWINVVFFALLLVASLELRRRKAWARYAFVSLVGLASLGVFIGVYFIVRELVLSADLMRGINEEAGSLRTAMVLRGALALARSLVTLIFLAWTAARLTHTTTKEEFEAPQG